MMYLILYNSSSTFKNIRIANEIKQKYKQWAVLSDNSFVIVSTDDAAQVRDDLQTHIGKGDKLFVTKITPSAAWIGYTKQVSDWLKKIYTQERDSKKEY